MKTLRYKFTIEANKVEFVEIEVPDDASEDEIEREVNAEYDMWMSNNMLFDIERIEP